MGSGTGCGGCGVGVLGRYHVMRRSISRATWCLDQQPVTPLPTRSETEAWSHPLLTNPPSYRTLNPNPNPHNPPHPTPPQPHLPELFIERRGPAGEGDVLGCPVHVAVAVVEEL